MPALALDLTTSLQGDYSEQKCFAKQHNRIGFPKFKMLHGSFFNGPFKIMP